jgi:hypothetical protein
VSITVTKNKKRSVTRSYSKNVVLKSGRINPAHGNKGEQKQLLSMAKNLFLLNAGAANKI